MSADNYFLIRRDGEGFVVSMGFASDANDPDVRKHDPRFDTIKAAREYADSEYSEYGYRERLEDEPDLKNVSCASA